MSDGRRRSQRSLGAIQRSQARTGRHKMALVGKQRRGQPGHSGRGVCRAHHSPTPASDAGGRQRITSPLPSSFVQPAPYGTRTVSPPLSSSVSP